MGRIAFWCALIGLGLLLAATIVGGAVYPGYDHLREYISELGATGTVTGEAVSVVFIVSGLLMAAFWGLCIIILPRSGLAVTGFVFSILNGFGLLFGGVFRCDFECLSESASASQTLHEALGGFGYLFGVLGVFLVGIAARKWPGAGRLFPLSLICGVPAVAALTFIGPEFEFYGAAQRVLELSIAVWTIAVALTVHRWPRT
ncbi:hypothetical protein BH10PSE1_BH10PSE1_22450 [soil metagenome]